MTVLIFDPRAFPTPKQVYKAAAHNYRHFEFCAEQHERWLNGSGRLNRFCKEYVRASDAGNIPKKPAGFSYAAVICPLHQAKLRRAEYAEAKRRYFDALHAIQFADPDSRVHIEACFAMNNVANRYRYLRHDILGVRAAA